MAGRAKQGLDYAAWSTDIFDNDPKIDKLLDAHGWVGFGVYFYLCMRAMGGNGYYYQWCFDDCASTARKMGCGVGAGTIQEVVGYCLQIGLFDKGLFDGWGVLTSRGIQRSYWLALKSRRSRTAIKELWLLQKEECEGLVLVPQNGDMSVANGDMSVANGDMSVANGLKGKESKGKERIVYTPLTRFEEFVAAYPKAIRNLHATETAYCKLLRDDANLKEFDLIIAAENYADSICILGTDERYIKEPQNFLKDDFWVQYAEGNYRPPEPPKPKKRKWAAGEQHNYDFERIEKELTGI